MDNLFIARSQMAYTLGMHIIPVCISMILPLFIFICEVLAYRTGDDDYIQLARRWTKLVMVSFGIGAVTGTLLSVELNTLFPHFIAFAGKIFGFPFALEFYAFMFEVVFLVLYVYGRDRLPKIMTVLSSFGVFLCATMSGFVVISANGWMNSPQGFQLDANGQVIESSINFIQATFNPAFIPQSFHMTIAAMQSTSFLFAGLYAILLLWGRVDRQSMYKKAFFIALTTALIASISQFGVADMLAKQVCRLQPIKCAAMEAHYHTEKGAPLRIGGIPFPEKAETKYAIEIPKMLSILAFGKPDAEVKGLMELAPNPKDRAPEIVVHFAFQIMVAIGGALAGLSILCMGYFGYIRRKTGTWSIPKNLFTEFLLYSCIGAMPLGFIAVEAGWTVTEVGRQPWIIQGIMRTADAVTTAPVAHQFYTFVGIYAFLLLAFIFSVYSLIIRAEFKK